MINFRKILELHFEDISQRTISSSTGHSRNTVSEVVQRAKKLGLEKLNDTMTNPWLEAFLFPEKQAIEKGYFPVDWELCIRNFKKRMLPWHCYIMNMLQKHVREGKSLMLIVHIVRSMVNMRRSIN